MPTAFLFPGQGSQTTDMRAEVAAVRPDLLEAATAIVGCDPFERVGESTRYAQPAIYCASLAGLARLEAAGETADVTAGHSLGELAALVAAGAINEFDGLRLVALRGEVMAATGERRGRAGCMLAGLGRTLDTIEPEAPRVPLENRDSKTPRRGGLDGATGGGGVGAGGVGVGGGGEGGPDPVARSCPAGCRAPGAGTRPVPAAHPWRP